MINGKKDTYDYVEEAVKEYWKNNYPQDVVVFFEQKYDFEDDSKWYAYEELVESHSCEDYENMTFLNDFCEGETCIRNITVVPLSTVSEYYRRLVLAQDSCF